MTKQNDATVALETERKFTCSVCGQRAYWWWKAKAAKEDGQPLICKECWANDDGNEYAKQRKVADVFPWAVDEFRWNGKFSSVSFGDVQPTALLEKYKAESPALPWEKWATLELLGSRWRDWIFDQVSHAEDYLTVNEYKLSQRTHYALSAATVVRRLAGLSPEDYRKKLSHTTGRSEGEELPGLLTLLHTGEVTEEKAACVAKLMDFLSLNLAVARMKDWLQLYYPLFWFFRGNGKALESQPEEYSFSVFEFFLEEYSYARDAWDAAGLTYEDFNAWWSHDTEDEALDDDEVNELLQEVRSAIDYSGVTMSDHVQMACAKCGGKYNVPPRMAQAAKDAGEFVCTRCTEWEDG